jgi:hypothetical protein
MKIARTADVLVRAAHIRTHLIVIDLFLLIQRGESTLGGADAPCTGSATKSTAAATIVFNNVIRTTN